MQPKSQKKTKINDPDETKGYVLPKELDPKDYKKVTHFPEKLLDDVDLNPQWEAVSNSTEKEIRFELLAFQERTFVDESYKSHNYLNKIKRVRKSEIPWDAISIYSLEEDLIYFLNDYKTGQTLFLRGWLEINLYFQKKIYMVEDAERYLEAPFPDMPDDFFFRGKENSFALEAMGNYYEKYQKEKKPPKRPSFFKNITEDLFPIAEDSLIYFFKKRGTDENPSINVPGLGPMTYIRCKSDILVHPAIINYINFQKLIHYSQTDKGGKKINTSHEKNNIVEKNKRFMEEFLESEPDFPKEINTLLNKIADGKRIKDFPTKDQESINELYKSSRKFRYALKSAAMNRAFLQMEMADVKKWLDALVGGAAKILKEHIYAAVESILQPHMDLLQPVAITQGHEDDGSHVVKMAITQNTDFLSETDFQGHVRKRFSKHYDDGDLCVWWFMTEDGQLLDKKPQDPEDLDFDGLRIAEIPPEAKQVWFLIGPGKSLQPDETGKIKVNQEHTLIIYDGS